MADYEVDTTSTKADRPTHAVVTQALERFKLADEAEQEQRKRELDDLRFDAGEQWPSEVIAQRNGSGINGLRQAPRPMLTIPKLDQPMQLIVNQAKSAHLGINVQPKSEDASDDTAEVFQDLYRTIQVESRASLARNWAFERAVKCGRGYYRVLTEYANDGDQDQDIVIKRILNQHSVYMDPFAIEPDGSDAEWAFIIQQMQFGRYKRLYGKSQLAGYDDDEFEGLGDAALSWVTGDGEGRMIRVAEYFRVEGSEQSRKVMWATINCVEVLATQQWEGRFIPIIPVIGREKNINGKRQFDGIIGPNKDAARLFNYAISTAVESTALEPKSPYIGAEGQFENHEDKWNTANTKNWPYLEYKPTSLNGELLPPPQRNVATSPHLLASLQLAQMADEAIKSGTFVHDPSLGDNKQSKNQSGRAVQAWQQQADAGNSNYMLDFADVSLSYEARVVCDLIPKIYDRPGRIARVRGIDDEVRPVMLNQPYLQGPEGQMQPMPPGMPPPKGAKVLHYDLKKGVYTVTPTVGKSWQTRLQQGADEIGVVMASAPELMAVIGDIYFKFRDFPGHSEIAERLKKMVDPKLLSDDTEPDAQALQQQLQQMGQQLELLSKELEQRVKQIETDEVKMRAQVEMKLIDAQSREQIERMQNETKLAIERMKIDLAQAKAIFDAEVEQVGMGQSQVHESAEADKARQHTSQEAGQDRQHQSEEAGEDRNLSEQQHAEDLRLQEQESQASREHELTMAEQAAQDEGASA